MKLIWPAILSVFLGTVALAQGQDPTVWLNDLASADPSIRQTGFYAIEKAQIASTNDQVKVGLITLLTTEKTYANQQAAQGIEVSEGYGDYFSDVVNAVAGLHDSRSALALSSVIETGGVVADAVVGFGSAALPPLFAAFQSTNPIKRFAVVTTIGKMMAPANLPTVSDAVSRSYVRTILSRAVADSDSDVASSAQESQSVFGPHDLVGDLNDDGKVDCTDLAIVMASFGKKQGQIGFDPRADVTLDGVVDVRDLAFVSQRVPAGTHCS